MREKTATDKHWNDRARTVSIGYNEVNIPDIAQRELELGQIMRHLEPDDHVLEAVLVELDPGAVPVGHVLPCIHRLEDMPIGVDHATGRHD